MPQSTFSIRMEENLKTQFEGLCDSFGMNMNTAFNVFARAVVRERRIPFEICEGKNQITREGALAAFDAIRAKAIQDGVADMSLEEMNAEIAKVRHGERQMKYYAVVDTNVLVSSLILKKDDTATIANNLSYDLIEKLCGLLEEQVIE